MLLRLQGAAEAMAAMVNNQERTANNLANANTVGYKADRSFVEALNEHLDPAGSPSSELRVTQWADMRAGALEQTGNPMDLALGSDGFFVVGDDEAGEQRYTRAGRFTLDSEGTLRTPGGLLVEGTGGPIHVPAGTSEVRVDSDGTIHADGRPIDRLLVVRFEDPVALERADGSTFLAGDVEPEEVESPLVKQGFVESSNVNAITEMANMIEHFRLFEAQQRLLQTSDQVLGKVTTDLGRF